MDQGEKIQTKLPKMLPPNRTIISFKNFYLFCKVTLLIVLISSLRIGHCQQQAGEGSQNNATTTTTSTTLVNLTTPVVSSSDINEPSELIMSGEEFVDSREVPLLLFDGTANEDSRAPSPASNGTTNSKSSQLLPPIVNHLNGNQNEGSEHGNVATTSTTTPQPATTNSVETSGDESNGGGHEENTGADLDDVTDEDSDNSSSRPADGNNLNLVNNVFEPPQNISQYMDYVEKLFHDLRHQIAHLFEPHLPQLIRTSQMVELTSSCSYDMLRLALALRQFEPWALRMIDSSGKVPEGIFEGSFTALGSYDECLSTVFQSASSSREQSSTWDQPASGGGGGKQAAPTQGQYCLVTVSPFMPPKPPADQVDRLFQEEANRRNYTKDDQFARLSPMFYYMQFRIGVCIPSTCDQNDMESISSALSSSLRLNITIPDCRVRQTDEQLTRHQLVGGLLFGSVVALVILATLIDCFKLKWKQLECQDIEFIQVANKQHVGLRQRQLPAGANNCNPTHQHQQQQQQSACRFYNNTVQHHEGAVTSTRAHFLQRLAKHWSWMSFSLIANFRLYFESTFRGQVASVRVTQSAAAATTTTTTTITSALNHNDRDRPSWSGHQQMIACLNGIRVLSLCWIIVANSYLTLDPRATKRLTKTREAPRDFLFQLVVQASLAIETFFFLSGLLMSLSFARHLKPDQSNKSPSSLKGDQREGSLRVGYLLKWVQFYVHRYVRMTPPTMLVIALSMFAYHYGDGPLWFEATQKVHQSCSRNWWRHLLHVANFIDTRQMCFIHYWYIAADMQLFLVAPLIMFLLFKCRHLGYLLITIIGGLSIGLVFYTTYTRNLPPTLLFYSTDPESRREFGNTIMTKPLTHAMPYLVGMLVGWWCVIMTNDLDDKLDSERAKGALEDGQRNGTKKLDLINAHQLNGDTSTNGQIYCMAQAQNSRHLRSRPRGAFLSASSLFGSLALAVALIELFLPYKWNNSQLPTRLVASIYAAIFRLFWSLVLAYVVISCRHQPGAGCKLVQVGRQRKYCHCGSGGNLLNRLLSFRIFEHLSKLSFVAYLIHLPLMSVFIGQTRGLFAFSHTLVLHFAVSYLVISFALALVLVHFIEFPFITFERLLFQRLARYITKRSNHSDNNQKRRVPKPNTLEAVKEYEKYLYYQDPRTRRPPATIQSSKRNKLDLSKPNETPQHNSGSLVLNSGGNQAANELTTTINHSNKRNTTTTTTTTTTQNDHQQSGSQITSERL